ncbi:hypothetical protein WMZ97_18455 [Lentibacillus sp. N15]|uniref:flagellin N-terminal helical domain-containing protein n=1 Tax=Lentibacillus songyuanensis TaxID=3136161 RepID=UPI0031B9FAC0
MRLNHNTSGLNTLNKMRTNNVKVNSAMGKLASGMGIIKATDDSVGLAISEK